MSYYKDKRKLGSGGYGEVWCVSKADGKLYAKKVLIDDSPDAVKRFQREVRILASLDHPRIIEIRAVRLINKPFWYVMPLYKGSLRNEFPGIVGEEDRVIKVMTAILEGMRYAHEQGILHRDLKPENILLNSDDDVVISDFGLGRAIDADTSRATSAGRFLGTVGYMAPEQATDAKSADHRSDIFSIGRILYELFSGDTFAAVQDLKRLPVHVAMIVDKCTKSDPDERFQSVEELHKAFMSIVVARGKQSDNERILELMEKAIDNGTLTDDETDELADLVAKVHDNPDLLHDLCMKLPAQVIGSLWEVSPVATKLMIKVFTDKLAVGGWDFGYTDEIGRVCMQLHNVIPDYDVRGMLIAAIVEVGVSHNRWNVMDLAAKLLSGRKEPGEGLAIAHALRDFSHRVRALEDRIVLSKVDPAIRVLFRDER